MLLRLLHVHALLSKWLFTNFLAFVYLTYILVGFHNKKGKIMFLSFKGAESRISDGGIYIFCSLSCEYIFVTFTALLDQPSFF